MQPKLDWNDPDFQGLARRHVRELGKTADHVLTTSARRIVHRAIVLSPPTKGTAKGGASLGTGTFKEQLDVGKAAIKRDLVGGGDQAGVFVVLDKESGASARSVKNQSTAGPWKFLFKTASGDTFYCHPALYRPGASIGEMKEFHDIHRGARGQPIGLPYRAINTKGQKTGLKYRAHGDPVLVPGMVVGKQPFLRYFRDLVGHIGWAKGAWFRALQALGGKVKADKAVPSWITRHSGAPGRASKKPTTGKLTIIFENLVGYANRWNNADRILATAFREEKTKLEYDLKKALEAMAARETKKKASIK